MGNYQSAASFGKAVKKTLKSLPEDEVYKKAVVGHLYKSFFPEAKQKATYNVRENDDNKVVIQFYNNDDISQQLPGTTRTTRLLHD